MLKMFSVTILSNLKNVTNNLNDIKRQMIRATENRKYKNLPYSIRT